MSESVPLRVADIEPNPLNPRKIFDPQELERLAESIKEVGVLQPVVVTPVEKGAKKGPARYRLICGERRWRAAQTAGLETIPCVVVEGLTAAQQFELMLIENLQRRDLDPIEEARAIQTLIQEHRLKQEEVAKKIGVTQGHISNQLRLLELPDEVKDDISRGILTPAHGRALLKIKAAPAFVKDMAAKAAAENLSSRELEDRITNEIRWSSSNRSRKLYKDFDGPAFDTVACEKCKYVVEVENVYGKKQPHCVDTKCWDGKQAAAEEQKRAQFLKKIEKAKDKGKVVKLSDLPYGTYVRLDADDAKDVDRNKCAGCSKLVAAQTYGDELVELCVDPGCVKKQKAAAARVKTQETKTKTKEVIDQLNRQPVEIADPFGVNEMVQLAQAVWYRKVKDAGTEALVDRASLLPLETLLKYFATKNELCAEASLMPGQFGRVEIEIPEQGIFFSDREAGGAHDAKQRRGALSVSAKHLNIATENGRITDAPPALPVYYRICVRQAGSSRWVRQLVGIRTDQRIILLFGDTSVQMRKDIWARWVKLIEALPPAPDLKVPGVKGA